MSPRYSAESCWMTARLLPKSDIAATSLGDRCRGGCRERRFDRTAEIRRGHGGETHRPRGEEFLDRRARGVRLDAPQMTFEVVDQPRWCDEEVARDQHLPEPSA